MKQRLVSFFLLLFLTACGGRTASPTIAAVSPTSTNAPPQPTQSESAPQFEVMASTTLLADIAQNVAGERVHIGSVLPVGADPHSYQYTPQDVAKVADVELLILFDDKYELFLEPMLQAANGHMEFVYASTGVNKRLDPALGGFDPHIWLDPNNVIVCVENIREGLTHLDPDGAAVYKANADAYVAELQALDAWIVEQVNQIPPEKRLLVTNHEALGYFAKRYGFTVVGNVLPSFSADASPSAQQMAALIDQIKASGAPAIFLDASDNPTLAQQIADETGVRVVTDLHLESLTDGAPAATYIEMMKSNVTAIVDALK
ncbi:MAG: zinc ABC transporter substrate-binding protein [Anaerolineae bacterium]|nr:MAG: zinc ABC transporter substrate-binding protein [Anaerolineae bacterium]WKZ43831.1 MAG: metal ABC transporter substrate-binding protein [Anaerolineales bacterium]